MLSSIHPLGERARRNRWHTTVAAYILGSLAGGLVAGAAAGALGAAVGAGGRPSLAMAGVLALVAAAIELRWLPVRLPSPRRQVDEAWLDTYRGWVYGAGFGVQLGLGVTTIITTPAVHLTFAVALLGGSAVTGAAVGAAFGLVRALPILATRTLNDPARLRSFHRRLALAEPAIRHTSAVGLAGAGLVLTAIAASGGAGG